MEFPKHQIGPRESFESPAELLAQGVMKIVDQTDANIAVEVYHDAHGMPDASAEEQEQARQEFINEGRNELVAFLKDSPVSPKVVEVYDAYGRHELTGEEAKLKMRDIIVHSS